MITEIVKRTCPVCDGVSFVHADKDKVARWRAGEHIQDVFPQWTASQRELLMTGTHDACWAELAGPDE